MEKKWRIKNQSKETMYLRSKALSKRTNAELWAENIIKFMFEKNEFIVEYVFKCRRFDFYFPFVRVALEIDGGYHFTKKQKIIDQKNDEILYKNFKIKVLRVKNFDELSLQKILFTIKRQSENKLKMGCSKRLKNKILNKNDQSKKTPKLFKPKIILRKSKNKKECFTTPICLDSTTT